MEPDRHVDRTVWVPLGGGLLLELQAPERPHNDVTMPNFPYWRIKVTDGFRQATTSMPEPLLHQMPRGEVLEHAVREAMFKVVESLLQDRRGAIAEGFEEAERRSQDVLRVRR
jgi:hypothetical protein